jgi:hypothetical protein
MTESKPDPGAQEQARVRVGALAASAVSAVLAVVALGLQAWLWAIGLALLFAVATSWAVRMYTALDDYRRQALALNQVRATYAEPDPYSGGE